jgi:hypothetical protein
MNDYLRLDIRNESKQRGAVPDVDAEMGVAGDFRV